MKDCATKYGCLNKTHAQQLNRLAKINGQDLNTYISRQERGGRVHPRMVSKSVLKRPSGNIPITITDSPKPRLDPATYRRGIAFDRFIDKCFIEAVWKDRGGPRRGQIFLNEGCFNYPQLLSAWRRGKLNLHEIKLWNHRR